MTDPLSTAACGVGVVSLTLQLLGLASKDFVSPSTARNVGNDASKDDCLGRVRASKKSAECRGPVVGALWYIEHLQSIAPGLNLVQHCVIALVAPDPLPSRRQILQHK